MPIKEINKALKTNFKELDRAYLNTLESVDARLLAAYKTTLGKIGNEIQAVYAKFGSKPSITEVRKFNRLVTIEKQISDKIVELDRTVRNVISSQIKTTLVESYSSTVNGINQGLGFEFTSAALNEEGMKRFLTDTLWSDSMKNNSVDLMSKVKRDFETVLRANSREEILAGVAEGKSYASIMKDLQARFEISANRAKTIAFTETHKAHSYARDEGITNAMDAAKEFGIDAHKVWRHNGVGKPRPDHVEADGTFANKDGMFNVGGEELSAPGLGSDPANNINCHCSAEFEVEDNTRSQRGLDILASKADDARIIFQDMYGKEGVGRKDIIDRLMSEAGLTKAGASTYYQNIKKETEAGLIQARTTKPPVSSTTVSKISKFKQTDFMNYVLDKEAASQVASSSDYQSFANQIQRDHNIKLKFDKSMARGGEVTPPITRGELQLMNKHMDEVFREMDQRSALLHKNGSTYSKNLKDMTLYNKDFLIIPGDKDRIVGYYNNWHQDIHLSTRVKQMTEIPGTGGGSDWRYHYRGTAFDDKIRTGQWTVSESFKSLVRHEFGHHIEMETVMGDAVDSAGKGFRDIYMKVSKSSLRNLVSEYGSSNVEEAFAESFAAMMNPNYGKGANRLPRLIENWFIDAFEMKVKFK